MPEQPKKKGRTWAQRKDRIQSIAVYRDLAQMAASVARDQGVSVAELTDPLLRGPLVAKYRQFLDRELRTLKGTAE